MKISMGNEDDDGRRGDEGDGDTRLVETRPKTKKPSSIKC